MVAFANACQMVEAVRFFRLGKVQDIKICLQDILV